MSPALLPSRVRASDWRLTSDPTGPSAYLLEELDSRRRLTTVPLDRAQVRQLMIVNPNSSTAAFDQLATACARREQDRLLKMHIARAPTAMLCEGRGHTKYGVAWPHRELPQLKALAVLQCRTAGPE